MRIKIKFKSIAVYAVYGACALCINSAAGGAPFALGLCFAMLACGANIFAVPVIYVLAAIPSLNWVVICIALFEGGFLCAVTAIYRRANKKIKYEYVAFMAVALAPFVAFSPWLGIRDLYITQNQYIIRAIAAVAVLIFSVFCLKAVYALMYRLCRCRLKSDELVCLTLVFTVTGIGFFNLAGLHIYLAACIGAAVLAARFFRDGGAMCIACVLGLPPTIITLSPAHIAILTLLTAVCLLFLNAGRGAPGATAIICGGAWFYFTGGLTSSAAAGIINGLLLCLCCLAATLPSDRFLERTLCSLRVKSMVPEMFEQKLRDATARKLFATSQVFREVEQAFTAIDSVPGEEAMQESVLAEIKGRLCARCDRRERCGRTDVYRGFARLMHSGRIKGRVSLVDLPAEVTTNCAHPADVIAEINSSLARLKRLCAEAENARGGRQLLANQANGISEVLKGAAVDIMRGGKRDKGGEKVLERAFASAGICCSEIKMGGEDGGEILLTVCGKAAAADIGAVLQAAQGAPFALKDKVKYSADKTGYLFVRPPAYDAAFGVAFEIKEGERASGDTHSVIKINEHSFLMALCDGMGSGERAKQVSSTTISLIEAFFRAEMPTDTILETVNKLMSFNRDESFTCMDIAAVDLNLPHAAFIKIGSPAAVIIKRDGIRIMESTSLPMGILDSIKPTVGREMLADGDIIIFMSDGISSAFASATDLYAFLEKLKPLNPQKLADDILEGAKKAARNVVADDMTVLCVRIFARS